MPKKAFITGINGQDGSYLAELLLKKNYHVIGLNRNSQAEKHPSLRNNVQYITGDLSDGPSIYAAVKETLPDELYNLASQSYPGESWNRSLETAKTNGLGAHLLYDTIKQIKPECRIFQASSSDMFGEISETPQSETTPFKPLNPYAAAKIYAHQLAQIYRKSYHMFISCGILFNHESPRRGLNFITQKVTYGAACLKLGITTSPYLNEKGEPTVNQGKLSLGNLDARRDWGYAGDYVEAMWLMLQQEQPDDFVIGTGISHSIRELCDIAFRHVGLNWEDYIVIDPRFSRPSETGPAIANTDKAASKLNWQAKTSFHDLVTQMVDHHLEMLK